MNILFFGVDESDLKELDLNLVPRVGDYLALNAGKTYRVTKIVWVLTQPLDHPGLRNVQVHCVTATNAFEDS
jgi:hypothetical protein